MPPRNPPPGVGIVWARAVVHSEAHSARVSKAPEAMESETETPLGTEKRGERGRERAWREPGRDVLGGLVGK